MPDRKETDRVIKAIMDDGNEHYYAWVKQMMTVSTGSLALLVALQNNFVPENPRILWSLILAWIGLALAIVTAAVVLHGRHSVLFGVAQKRADEYNAGEFHGSLSAKPHWMYAFSYKLMMLSLVVAVVSLTSFAIVNLGNTLPN